MSWKYPDAQLTDEYLSSVNKSLRIDGPEHGYARDILLPGIRASVKSGDSIDECAAKYSDMADRYRERR